MKKKSKSKKLWGGGYRKPTAKAVERFTSSIAVDQRLAMEDLDVATAHAKMLGKCKIIPRTVSKQLVQGLAKVRRDWQRGKIDIDPSAEDIHSVLYAALEKRIGKTAEHLNTARSRNDQVITDTKLYCLRVVESLTDQIQKLQRVILRTARQHKTLIVPAYTHLQHAQPVLWAHALLGYCEALERDKGRLEQLAKRLDELPLGSGAIAGTGLPIDRKYVARELGFSRVAANSIDIVSDRDSLLELVSALAILGIHLGRVAEDLIIWSSPGFGYVQLDESVCTGSSMMPQKQNPDFLELTRAGAGALQGHWTGLASVLKGIPSGYNRDLQMDKVHLFSACDTATGMLEVLIAGFQGLTINKTKVSIALQDQGLYATDLAEYLVAKGVAFAQAHRISGEVMRYCRKSNKRFSQLSLTQLKKLSDQLELDAKKLFDPVCSVKRKQSFGSTQTTQVQAQLKHWQQKLR